MKDQEQAGQAPEPIRQVRSRTQIARDKQRGKLLLGRPERELTKEITMSQRGVVHEENDMGDGRLTTMPMWRNRGVDQSGLSK
jgi:hypothetical protein